MNLSLICVSNTCADPFWWTTEIVGAAIGAGASFFVAILLFQFQRKKTRKERRKVLLTALAFELASNSTYLTKWQGWAAEIDPLWGLREHIKTDLSTVTYAVVWIDVDADIPADPELSVLIYAAYSAIPVFKNVEETIVRNLAAGGEEARTQATTALLAAAPAIPHALLLIDKARVALAARGYGIPKPAT